MPDLELPGWSTSLLAVSESHYTHLYHTNRFSRNQNIISPGAAEGLAVPSLEAFRSKVEHLHGARGIENGMSARRPLSDNQPAAILAERERFNLILHRA